MLKKKKKLFLPSFIYVYIHKSNKFFPKKIQMPFQTFILMIVIDQPCCKTIKTHWKKHYEIKWLNCMRTCNISSWGGNKSMLDFIIYFKVNLWARVRMHILTSEMRLVSCLGQREAYAESSTLWCDAFFLHN